MSMTHDAIRVRLSDRSETLKSFDVESLWLFGSAARGNTVVNDLDFMVQFSQRPGLENFMELKFFLEETFGLPVDLHSRASCPQRFLKRIETDLKHVA